MLKNSFKVEWGDTDAAAIVFYPNYYRWMNNATHEFIERIGYSYVKMFGEDRIGIPLLETHCQFFTPSFFGDTIVVTSRIEEVCEKTFKIAHTFHRDGTKLAEGYEVRAWTDFSNKKPKAYPIPDDIREKMIKFGRKENG